MASYIQSHLGLSVKVERSPQRCKLRLIREGEVFRLLVHHVPRFGLDACVRTPVYGPAERRGRGLFEGKREEPRLAPHHCTNMGMTTWT